MKRIQSWTKFWIYGSWCNNKLSNNILKCIKFKGSTRYPLLLPIFLKKFHKDSPGVHSIDISITLPCLITQWKANVARLGPSSTANKRAALTARLLATMPSRRCGPVLTFSSFETDTVAQMDPMWRQNGGVLWKLVTAGTIKVPLVETVDKKIPWFSRRPLLTSSVDMSVWRVGNGSFPTRWHLSSKGVERYVWHEIGICIWSSLT